MTGLLPIDARNIPKTFASLAELPDDAPEARFIGPPPDVSQSVPPRTLRRLWLQNMKVDMAARLALQFDPVQLSLTNVQSNEMTWTSGLTNLRELLIEWNTKLDSLAFLRDLPQLCRLRADGLKRVNRLDGLTHQPSLQWLWIGGGIDRRLEIENLQPLADLKELERLYLVAIQLRDPSLAPLAALQRIKRLHIQTNAAPMEEYARLAAALPPAEGAALKGYSILRRALPEDADLIEVIDELPDDEWVIMVGKGGRRLKVATDRKKIIEQLLRFRTVRDAERERLARGLG